MTTVCVCNYVWCAYVPVYDNDNVDHDHLHIIL